MRIGIILLIIGLSGISERLWAQVGINNPNPNPISVLDLSNLTDGSLVLSVAGSSPSSVLTFNLPGMVFYLGNYLNAKTSAPLSVLSLWMFNGTSANGTNSHALSVNNAGSGTAHENRPPTNYALIYLIKI